MLVYLRLTYATYAYLRYCTVLYTLLIVPLRYCTLHFGTPYGTSGYFYRVIITITGTIGYMGVHLRVSAFFYTTVTLKTFYGLPPVVGPADSLLIFFCTGSGIPYWYKHRKDAVQSPLSTGLVVDTFVQGG